MPAKRILILGGTASARGLAELLLREGYDVTTSLAGVTREPIKPAGKLRRGGFGGTDGLLAYLGSEAIDAVVDATHPFAAQISRHACEATQKAGIACLRLEIEPWLPEAGDQWTIVQSAAEAAAALPSGARCFVTIGRKEIGAFFSRPDISGLARMIEPPDAKVPEQWQLLLARPPFNLAAEMVLIEQHGFSHIVCKNAGGESTRAKIIAARQAGLPVVMIARPSKPRVPAFPNIDALAQALRQTLSP